MRGGSRSGAGRKGFCEKAVPVCWRISERAKVWIQTEADERKQPMGAVIDDLIDSYEQNTKGVR